ncbi:MAG: heme NO-binding domain-containing protein [Planctomycetota bacterium]|nr:heme NO-binding domain-containing protein [Planctomycetota bacterium]
MKGIVFTEFLDLVETAFGYETVDEILIEANPASGGAYTSVGTYDHRELIDLVVALSARTGTAIPELMHAFGKHLFGRFVEGFPSFFEDTDDPLAFLASVENVIHVEVRKLYPDAELPTFDHEHTEGGIELTYRSPRPFATFAEGLIEGCIEHFGKPFEVVSEDRSEGDESTFLFRIQ